MGRQNKAIVLGFDLDGVILDHTKAKIQIAASLGCELTPHQTPSDILKQVMPEVLLQKLKERIYDTWDIALSSPLMPGLRTFLMRIQDAGVPFVLISRRKNPVLAVKILRRHNLWPRVFNEHNTFFVLDKEAKNKRAAELGVTHYIDDEEAVLAQLTDVKYKFLFDHFGVLGDSDHCTRITSWNEAERFLLSS